MTASKGNSIRPSGARVNTPAFNRAVTSPCTAFTSRSTRRAASRIDIGPAPQSTFRSSQRFAVSTCQSNSGVAKLIRASRSARPVFIARVASAKVSRRERTSRTTVFMVPPRHISFKIGDRLIRCGEDIWLLHCAGVPVITLSAFVVVTQHALLFDYVCQPVFKRMRRGRDRLGNVPDHHLDECVGSNDDPATSQRYSAHVGDSTNSRRMLSITPTWTDSNLWMLRLQ